MKSHPITIKFFLTALTIFHVMVSCFVWATDSTAHIHPEIRPKDPKDMLTIYQYYSANTNQKTYISNIQSALEDNGISVLSINTGYDGLIYPLKNNSFEQGHIVIVTIRKKDWDQGKIDKKDFHKCSDLEDMGGHCYIGSYANLFPNTRSKHYVAVYKSAKNKQCSEQTEQSLNKSEQELIENKIFVYKKYKGTSGELYTLQCGNDTNMINVYVIESSKLGIALSLGFQECAYLKTKGQDCYPY